MGKIIVTYKIECKKKAVELYLKERMIYKTVAKEFRIHHSVLSCWMKHFEAEGIKGLEKNVVKRTNQV